MATVRNIFWALALLSLSLAAAPATTKPVATKGKAAPTKSTGKAATKAVATKAPAARVPTKATPKTTVSSRTATPYKAPATRTRAQVQPQPKPQYNRYATRRQLATRTPVRQQARPVYRPAPMAPTPERTKEIQSALAQKGYLSGEPSGTWDADSTAAMKRFQKDQNLDADGKFNSLSLIALGLGPKRTLTASTIPTTSTTPAPAPSKP